MFESHLDALLRGAGYQALEIFQRAELTVDRLMPSLVGADRPRATRIVRPGDRGVVVAPAERAADWVDRR